MTAIIGIAQGSAAHLVTDSLGRSEEFGEPNILPKAWPLPTLNAAVAVAGHSDMAALLVAAICRRAETYDDAVRCLPDAMRECQEVRSLAGRQGAQLAVLAGLSSTGPSPVVCTTDASAGFEPWVAHAANFFATPSSTNLYADFGLPDDTDDLDPARDGMRFMQMQRDRADKLSGATDPNIGGDVVLTTVHADRIEQRVVGRLK